ncbi:MAG: hypothetical protein Q8R48_05075, partial [Candidatus Omnitrophota bacterium]|nr:hypothetical protein [Candidatus Omnitrophota bacterium]
MRPRDADTSAQFNNLMQDWRKDTAALWAHQYMEEYQKAMILSYRTDWVVKRLDEIKDANKAAGKLEELVAMLETERGTAVEGDRAKVEEMIESLKDIIVKYRHARVLKDTLDLLMDSALDPNATLSKDKLVATMIEYGRVSGEAEEKLRLLLGDLIGYDEGKEAPIFEAWLSAAGIRIPSEVPTSLDYQFRELEERINKALEAAVDYIDFKQRLQDIRSEIFELESLMESDDKMIQARLMGLKIADKTGWERGLDLMKKINPADADEYERTGILPNSWKNIIFFDIAIHTYDLSWHIADIGEDWDRLKTIFGDVFDIKDTVRHPDSITNEEIDRALDWMTENLGNKGSLVASTDGGNNSSSTFAGMMTAIKYYMSGKVDEANKLTDFPINRWLEAKEKNSGEIAKNGYLAEKSYMMDGTVQDAQRQPGDNGALLLALIARYKATNDSSILPFIQDLGRGIMKTQVSNGGFVAIENETTGAGHESLEEAMTATMALSKFAELMDSTGDSGRAAEARRSIAKVGNFVKEMYSKQANSVTLFRMGMSVVVSRGGDGVLVIEESAMSEATSGDLIPMAIMGMGPDWLVENLGGGDPAFIKNLLALEEDRFGVTRVFESKYELLSPASRWLMERAGLIHTTVDGFSGVDIDDVAIPDDAISNLRNRKFFDKRPVEGTLTAENAIAFKIAADWYAAKGLDKDAADMQEDYRHYTQQLRNGLLAESKEHPGNTYGIVTTTGDGYVNHDGISTDTHLNSAATIWFLLAEAGLKPDAETARPLPNYLTGEEIDAVRYFAVNRTERAIIDSADNDKDIKLYKPKYYPLGIPYVVRGNLGEELIVIGSEATLKEGIGGNMGDTVGSGATLAAELGDAIYHSNAEKFTVVLEYSDENGAFSYRDRLSAKEDIARIIAAKDARNRSIKIVIRPKLTENPAPPEVVAPSAHVIRATGETEEAVGDVSAENNADLTALAAAHNQKVGLEASLEQNGERVGTIENSFIAAKIKDMDAEESGRSKMAFAMIQSILGKAVSKNIKLVVVNDNDVHIAGTGKLLAADAVSGTIYVSEEATVMDLVMHAVHEMIHISGDESETSARKADIDLIKKFKSLAASLKAAGQPRAADSEYVDALRNNIVDIAALMTYAAVSYEIDVLTAVVQNTDGGLDLLDKYELGTLENAPPSYLAEIAALKAAEFPAGRIEGMEDTDFTVYLTGVFEELDGKIAAEATGLRAADLYLLNYDDTLTDEEINAINARLESTATPHVEKDASLIDELTRTVFQDLYDNERSLFTADPALVTGGFGDKYNRYAEMVSFKGNLYVSTTNYQISSRFYPETGRVESFYKAGIYKVNDDGSYSSPLYLDDIYRNMAGNFDYYSYALHLTVAMGTMTVNGEETMYIVAASNQRTVMMTTTDGVNWSSVELGSNRGWWPNNVYTASDGYMYYGSEGGSTGTPKIRRTKDPMDPVSWEDVSVDMDYYVAAGFAAMTEFNGELYTAIRRIKIIDDPNYPPGSGKKIKVLVAELYKNAAAPGEAPSWQAVNVPGNIDNTSQSTKGRYVTTMTTYGGYFYMAVSFSGKPPKLFRGQDAGGNIMTWDIVDTGFLHPTDEYHITHLGEHDGKLYMTTGYMQNYLYASSDGVTFTKESFNGIHSENSGITQMIGHDGELYFSMSNAAGTELVKGLNAGILFIGNAELEKLRQLTGSAVKGASETGEAYKLRILKEAATKMLTMQYREGQGEDQGQVLAGLEFILDKEGVRPLIDRIKEVTESMLANMNRETSDYTDIAAGEVADDVLKDINYRIFMRLGLRDRLRNEVKNLDIFSLDDIAGVAKKGANKLVVTARAKDELDYLQIKYDRGEEFDAIGFIRHEDGKDVLVAIWRSDNMVPGALTDDTAEYKRKSIGADSYVFIRQDSEGGMPDIEHILLRAPNQSDWDIVIGDGNVTYYDLSQIDGTAELRTASGVTQYWRMQYQLNNRSEAIAAVYEQMELAEAALWAEKATATKAEYTESGVAEELGIPDAASMLPAWMDNTAYTGLKAAVAAVMEGMDLEGWMSKGVEYDLFGKYENYYTMAISTNEEFVSAEDRAKALIYRFISDARLIAVYEQVLSTAGTEFNKDMVLQAAQLEAGTAEGLFALKLVLDKLSGTDTDLTGVDIWGSDDFEPILQNSLAPFGQPGVSIDNESPADFLASWAGKFKVINWQNPSALNTETLDAAYYAMPIDGTLVITLDGNSGDERTKAMLDIIRQSKFSRSAAITVMDLDYPLSSKDETTLYTYGTGYSDVKYAITIRKYSEEGMDYIVSELDMVETSYGRAIRNEVESWINKFGSWTDTYDKAYFTGLAELAKVVDINKITNYSMAVLPLDELYADGLHYGRTIEGV